MIFGPKKEEVAGGWREVIMISLMANTTKYYLSGQIKEDKLVGHVACWRLREVHTGFWWRNQKEKTTCKV